MNILRQDIIITSYKKRKPENEAREMDKKKG
jgi:hypothetical protein